MSRNKQIRVCHCTRPARHGNWWVSRQGDDLIDVESPDDVTGVGAAGHDSDDYDYPTRNLYQTMECR